MEKGLLRDGSFRPTASDNVAASYAQNQTPDRVGRGGFTAGCGSTTKNGKLSCMEHGSVCRVHPDATEGLAKEDRRRRHDNHENSRDTKSTCRHRDAERAADILADCSLLAISLLTDLLADQDGAEGGNGSAATLGVSAKATEPVAIAVPAAVFFSTPPTSHRSWRVLASTSEGWRPGQRRGSLRWQRQRWWHMWQRPHK